MGALAMLQMASIRSVGALRWASLGSGIAVALVALAGGLLSLLQVATDLGGLLEFVATTIGLGWFAIFGLFVVATTRT